jgi:hypothetical protein
MKVGIVFWAKVEKRIYPYNRKWTSMVSWDVEAPTFSRQMAIDSGEVVSLTPLQPFTT